METETSLEGAAATKEWINGRPGTSHSILCVSRPLSDGICVDTQLTVPVFSVLCFFSFPVSCACRASTPGSAHGHEGGIGAADPDGAVQAQPAALLFRGHLPPRDPPKEDGRQRGRGPVTRR